MKNKSKKLLSAAAASLVAVLSAATVFASACGPDHEHEWDTEWSYDETNHWHACLACDEVNDLAAHTFDKGECTVCSYEDPDYQPETTTFSIEGGDTAALVSAISQAQPGDTIELAAGTYEFASTLRVADVATSSGAKTANNGTYDAYITVTAADDAVGEVVFDFSRQTFDGNNRGVALYTDYWYWYGIEVQGAGDNGMFIGGNYNIVEYCEFHNNRDTGLQLGRELSDMNTISQWPSYNLIKNCTSYNNYDNETAGENADGFAAKLTVGYGNVFDGCIAYRNSDDGWDLYAYQSNGDIGAVIMYNCVAFENGYLGETVAEFNDKVTCNEAALEDESMFTYNTQNGDGNGFKLGGSVMRGNVKMYNCLSFNNRMHGVTDNSNPGVISLEGITSYNNGADIDLDPESATYGEIVAPLASGGLGEGNNIDLARAETSHNNLEDVLSVADSLGGPGADAFKGSVGNSILYGGGTTYLGFTDYADAYSEDDNEDRELAAGLVAADIFAALPGVAGEDGQYALSGLENPDVHETYRNADESVNMGDILRIADSGAVSGAGAYLSEDSWEDYTHFYDSELSEAESASEAVVLAVYNTLYLYTDTDAVYQDFTLTTAMMGATISWTSSNSDILYIVPSYNSSNSNSQDVAIEVYRPADDTEVTLTAYISYRGATAQKTFELTVKAAAPELGDIYVAGLEDAVTEEARRFIIDQYEVFEEPGVVVEDGSDMNGKPLPEDLYDIEAVYEYAPSATETYSRVGEFSASVAGVYRITYNVTCNGETASYTYYIYVASNEAVIDFVPGTESLIVNRDGYSISGDVTNVKGTLYAYSTSDEAEIAQLNGMEDSAVVAQLSADEATEAYSFTDNSITAQFTNENNRAYTIYYWFTNGAGDLTSEVYSQDVSVETIATPAEFTSKLAGNNSYTIYLLTADLDFTGVEYTPVDSLYGLVNGDGHSIDNLTVSGSERVGMFNYLRGGTLMNVELNNISITSSGQRNGIFGQSYGGYISNVLINNLSLDAGNARNGALIGHHTAGGLYIDNVALINDDEHVLTASGNDMGGLIGLIQSSSSGVTFGEVVITDSMVYATLDGAGRNYVGGIVGRMEDRSVEDKFTLERCYSAAAVIGQQYVGGVIAAQNNSAGGAYVVSVTDCVFMGELYYGGNTEPLTVPEKNSSGIFGRYVETAVITISGCVSNIAEDGYAEYVQVAETRIAATESFWSSYTPRFDFENTWMHVDENADGTLEAPYVVLTFGGMFD